IDLVVLGRLLFSRAAIGLAEVVGDVCVIRIVAESFRKRRLGGLAILRILPQSRDTGPHRDRQQRALRTGLQLPLHLPPRRVIHTLRLGVVSQQHGRGLLADRSFLGGGRGKGGNSGCAYVQDLDYFAGGQRLVEVACIEQRTGRRQCLGILLAAVVRLDQDG